MSGSRLKRYLIEALRLLRQRSFRVLFDKGRRLSGMTASRISAAELASACADLNALVCVVDSAQGGGAAMAAERSARAWRARGAGTLRLGCDPLGNLSVVLTESRQTRPALSGRLADWPVLPDTVTQLEIHSLAGFIGPDETADWLIGMAQGALPVTLFWHDHFLICPTRHLLDPEHRYCGVPEVAECARCLPDNPNCLDAPLRQTDITLWRQHWGRLLNGISVIRVFSVSSAKLVERVWPEYTDKVRLQPHEVNLKSVATQNPQPETPLHVGVIGQISTHKGAAEVAALGRHIHDEGLAARITIFGNLEHPAPTSVVSQTGTYAPDALHSLCAEQGVNVFWFPSICPETFSFVLHEMKAMGLPILAYDVGAQADALATHPTGRLVALGAGPQEILSALLALREEAP
jgi:glycosyltransferase involved in cell wall biosynthesis